MEKERSMMVDLLRQQNQLLQSLNQLLKQQNDLVKAPSEPIEEREEFVENLYRDEMRCGFLVTSHRKKLWNVQIGLINEFARICDKHNLRWFAYGGTLLGAARHGGFIPWDDDVDLAMFRPEYEKFKRIAPTEIKSPYYLDNWYSYRLEEEEGNFSTKDPQMPVVSVKPNFFPKFPIIKIRDSRTSQIQWPGRKNVNQGIWIDIFPLDVLPPFKDKKQSMIFKAAWQLLIAVIAPDTVRQILEDNKLFFFKREEMEKFLQFPYSVRGAAFDNFMASTFFKSKYIGQFRGTIFNPPLKLTYETKDFDDITYLSFEKIKLPAPSNFDGVLTAQYDNWRKIIFTPPHSQIYSADIPYDEYFKTSTT